MRSGTNAALPDALSYLARGWAVIPVGQDKLLENGDQEPDAYHRQEGVGKK